MAHRTFPYKPFQEAYIRGCAAIERCHFTPGSITDREQLDELGDRLEEVALGAIRSLQETEFGRVLHDDSTPSDLLNKLDTGLRRLRNLALSSGVIAPDAPVIQWVDETGFSTEREFHFRGRLGWVLHYFRDLGASLDTGEEAALRKRCQAQSTALLRQLQEMTDHVAIQIAYKPNVVRRIEALQASLETLQTDLVAPMDVSMSDGPNPFHGGTEKLPRQFARAVGHMAFELFGHLTPHDLGLLLHLKSSTAEDLGFSAWGLKGADSRKRDQRNYIQTALDSAIRKGTTAGWVTLPLLKFFSENRDVVFRPDHMDRDEDY